MPVPERLARKLPVVLYSALAALYLLRLGAPSLWLDEAWEANYYVGFEPAPWYNRPILYMATVKTLAAVLGRSEFVLRLFPCLAGLAAVAITYRLARRFLPRFEAMLAAGIVALANPFLSYAHMLKNYSGDAFFAVLLVYLWTRYRDRRELPRLVALAAAGIVSVGYSFSAVFVLGGIALVEAALERRSPDRFMPFATAYAAIGAAVALDIWLFHRRAGSDRLLHEYFAEAYLPWRSPLAAVRFLVDGTKRTLVEQSGTTSAVATGLVAAAGVLGARPAWPVCAAAAGAALLNAGASALELYPFGVTRLSIYLAPFVALSIALGIARLREAGRGSWAGRLALAAALWLLLAQGWRVGIDHLRHGWRREEIRDLVARVVRDARAGEAVYVNEDAEAAFEFYWRRAGKPFPPVPLVIGARLRARPEEHAAEIERVAAAHETVWSVLTHLPAEESSAIVALFETRYEHLDARVVGDARLDRWKRRAP